MNNAYPLIITLFLIQNVLAQDLIKPIFGQLSQEEIDMKTCSFDTTANALVLFDIGKTKFVQEYGTFNILFTRHKRIKILTEQGFGNGEIAMTFYIDGEGNAEKVKLIEACTYTIANGKIQKRQLDPKTIYTEQINKWWKQKKFVFPNLKAGAILEYKYTHETPFIYNLTDWEFQSSIPTLYSEFQLRMTPFYEYVRLSQGIDSLSYEKTAHSKEYYSFEGVEYKESVITSVMKNVDGFKDQSYITSKNDYIKKFDYQLAKVHNLDGSSRKVIPTWAKLNRELLKSDEFGWYIKGCRRFAKKALERIDTTNQTKFEKIETLVKFVKESFYWNGYYSKFASQTAKGFYATKSGNVAEINLFLLALLREAGINADPMILSTRDHGKVSLLYPITKRFNYVLVFVNEEELSFITDATSPLTDFLTVPTRCINDYGLIVNKNKEGEWSKIQYNSPSVNIKSIVVRIIPEQKISEVSLAVKTTFFEAYKYRSTYKNDTLEIQKKFQENFDEIESLKTKNYTEPELPYYISLKAKKELSWINNYILINPFLGLAPNENMLKQDKRDYPVDMLYPKHFQYNVNLFFPKGYEVEKIPEPYKIDDDLVAIAFKAILDKQYGRIKVVGEYKFKKAIYSPEDYTLLKSHIDSIVDKFNPELILKAEKQND